MVTNGPRDRVHLGPHRHATRVRDGCRGRQRAAAHVERPERQERQEQVEGTLGWVRPRRVILTFTKVGELYGILGSNENLYWWIQLGKEKSAVWGEHAKVTEERTRRLGIPVQPLEVVELLGITALAGEGAAVEWSADGRSLVVTTPSAEGMRRVWMDPATHEPLYTIRNEKAQLGGPSHNEAPTCVRRVPSTVIAPTDEPRAT